MTDDGRLNRAIVVLDRLDYCASLKNLKGARYFLSVEFIKDDIAPHLLNHILQANVSTRLYLLKQRMLDILLEFIRVHKIIFNSLPKQSDLMAPSNALCMFQLMRYIITVVRFVHYCFKIS